MTCSRVFEAQNVGGEGLGAQNVGGGTKTCFFLKHVFTLLVDMLYQND